MANTSSIDHFKSTFLQKGLARPTRYRVEITTTAGSEINFQPESVTLPSRGFKQIEDNIYGPTRRIPIAREYSPSVVLVFPVSDDQTERTFFEAWMDEIVSQDDNMSRYTSGQSKSVFGSMVIKTLDVSDKESSKYTFNEVYPRMIMPTNMGQNMFNDYVRLQVEMDYRDYLYEATGYEA